MEGVASCAISSRGIMPSDSIEMIRYSVNTAANPSAVERPTSRTYFARPEITTAPSMPVKTQTKGDVVGRDNLLAKARTSRLSPEVVHKDIDVELTQEHDTQHKRAPAAPASPT